GGGPGAVGRGRPPAPGAHPRERRLPPVPGGPAALRSDPPGRGGRDRRRRPPVGRQGRGGARPGRRQDPPRQRPAAARMGRPHGARRRLGLREQDRRGLRRLPAEARGGVSGEARAPAQSQERKSRMLWGSEDSEQSVTGMSSSPSMRHTRRSRGADSPPPAPPR